MPSPSTSLASLRPELAGSLEEFDTVSDRMGFIGQMVLRVKEVEKQAGKFGRIPIEQLLQERDTKRAPGAGYARGNFTFTDESWVTEEHGAEEPVDDREEAMFATFFDAEVIAAKRAMDAVLRNAEIRTAAKVFDSTVWTGGLTTAATNEWDDLTNATPLDDVQAAMQSVWDTSGLWPNALIINRKVFRNVRRTDQVIDLMKAQNFQDVRPSQITAMNLALVFDIAQVIVAGSPRNVANSGQSVSISPIWSDEFAMVAKIAETDDHREPVIGRIFHWGEDGSTVGGAVESYREEQTRSDIIRVRHDVDEKIIYPESGHLLSNITT